VRIAIARQEKSASGKVHVQSKQSFQALFSKPDIEPATILGRSGLRDIAAL
jgi:hypothetical protein